MAAVTVKLNDFLSHDEKFDLGIQFIEYLFQPLNREQQSDEEEITILYKKQRQLWNEKKYYPIDFESTEEEKARQLGIFIIACHRARKQGWNVPSYIIEGDAKQPPFILRGSAFKNHRIANS